MGVVAMVMLLFGGSRRWDFEFN